MDDEKFKEILENCGLSAKGMEELNGLLSKSRVELLNGLINFNCDDIDNFSKIKSCMKNSANEISDIFYNRITEIEELKEKLKINANLQEQLKLNNIEYLNSFFDLNYNENYFKNTIALGLAHALLGISPSVYIVIYGYYANIVSSFALKCCQKEGFGLVDTLKTVNSIQKKLTVDTAFAIESYYKMSMDDNYKSERQTIGMLMSIAEYKDIDTGNHIARVSNYSKIIAKNIGLDGIRQERIFYSSQMHDIGKVGIADDILLKPGKLTEKEYEKMKTHCSIGYDILKDSNSLILKDGSIVAVSHHENFDGSGYPFGLKGEKIPIEGRICRIADVFDALVNKRCYKPAMSVENAIGIMEKEMKPGKCFDPDCFNAFLGSLDEIIQIKKNIDRDLDLDRNALFNDSDGSDGSIHP
jgi:HD-GYP domain-containing protein (c-di-GMP phosphodiesterase class II)